MNPTTDLQVGDAIEYIDPESGGHHAGTVLAIDFGSGWSEPRIRVQWDDMEPTYMRASTLRKLA